MAGAADVSKLWEEIVVLLQKLAPKRASELRPGASPQALDQIEKRLGQPLPDDYRASLAIHDGNASLSEFTYLGVDAAGEIRDAMNEEASLGSFEGLKIDAPEADTLKPLWWHQGLVPFAQDSGGALLCVDLDPGPNGKKGQVVLFERGLGPAPTAFQGFADWLAHYRDALQAGRFKKSAGGYLRDVGS